MRAKRVWACGAAGSALPWHGRGRRFDPDQVHQIQASSPAQRACASRLAGKVVGSIPTRSTKFKLPPPLPQPAPGTLLLRSTRNRATCLSFTDPGTNRSADASGAGDRATGENSFFAPQMVEPEFPKITIVIAVQALSAHRRTSAKKVHHPPLDGGTSLAWSFSSSPRKRVPRSGGSYGFRPRERFSLL
jgi:hypothetical protein